jgi:hypothetical protein
MSGLCCAYKRPYGHTEPWQCQVCGLIFAVPCEPVRTDDPSLQERWLAEAIADVQYNVLIPTWREMVVDALAERYAQGWSVAVWAGWSWVE